MCIRDSIEAIKRYFCSEYACMMVAQAAGVDYERMIAGEYKLLIEPIAYFTHNGQYYCMTAVSYTHLDVYKRQATVWGREPKPLCWKAGRTGLPAT